MITVVYLNHVIVGCSAYFLAFGWAWGDTLAVLGQFKNKEGEFFCLITAVFKKVGHPFALINIKHENS